MGTRADFYLGREPATMVWLGSIAMDGYPEGHPKPLADCRSEDDYRATLARIREDVDHWTDPDQGWPWPWEDSSTTDLAYAFDDGRVWASIFGHGWFDLAEHLKWRKEQGRRLEEARAIEDEGEREAAFDALYAEEERHDEESIVAPSPYPDMTDRQRVAYGQRSGLIIVGRP